MSSPHYSLRWNNHLSHLLTAFDSLLQNETLVDVTLICSEGSFKAHKVVLSACSPYFQKIFSETPCKHPVIVLKDLKGWEIQAIVDFMYRGEISVGQEQLQALILAAESLQVKGLTNPERIPVIAGSDKEGSSRSDPEYSPAASSTPPSHSHYNGSSGGGNVGGGVHNPTGRGSQPPTSVSSMRLPQVPLLPNISFSELAMRNCSSPQPRRKQARPRRRSGDTNAGSGPQDLSKPPTHSSQIRLDTAENLSMKKQINNNNNTNNNNNNNNNNNTSSRPSSQLNSTPSSPQINMKMERDDSEPPDSSQAYPMELTTTPQDHRMEYTADSLSMPPPHHESSLENSFPHLASISALSLTPPHRLFHGIENCRNPLLNDMEPRLENHISKKKMGRPKGQHSAPRGGPPRSWTNAELTEALQHVWNKKMTTSQASRIFGIPYNSLLMYVRGKYGKSLKLEQLKKECFGELTSPLDLLGLGNISNNNNPSPGTKQHKIPEPPEHMMLPPGFNPPYPPVPTGFYPDFTGFPVPVSMVHLLPQSEKTRGDIGGGGGGGGGGGPVPGVVDYSKDDSDDGGGGGRHHHNTPLDFAKDDLRTSPSMPLDFVKEETGNPHHDQTNCSTGGPEPNVECESPRDRRDQNGQD